jgi:putative tryptophan/tyrosine transport system substrate-binding protein
VLLHRAWTRRRFIGSAAGTALAAVAGCAPATPPRSQPQRVPRVGYVGAASADFPAPLGPPHVEAFRDGLRELGYSEGRNLRVEYRFAELRFDALAALAAELAGLPVDVLVAGDTRSIQPVKQAADARIPVVLVLTTDPVASGHVASLSRPGGNITGLTMAPLETMGKRVQLLRDAVPTVSHVGLLHNPDDGISARAAAEVAQAAAALGLAFSVLQVREPEDIAPAFQRASRDGVDGLVVQGDPLTNGYAPRVADLALAAGLPAIGMLREVAVAGLLMSYAPSLPALFHRAAAYVDKIVQGIPPAELPVERAPRFELVFNTRTASALGLRPSSQFLSQVTEVVS